MIKIPSQSPFSKLFNEIVLKNDIWKTQRNIENRKETMAGRSQGTRQEIFLPTQWEHMISRRSMKKSPREANLYYSNLNKLWYENIMDHVNVLN